MDIKGKDFRMDEREYFKRKKPYAIYTPRLPLHATRFTTFNTVAASVICSSQIVKPECVCVCVV